MTKPLNRTELSHLVFLHVQRDGMSYDQAKKAVAKLLEEVNTNHQKAKKNKYFQEWRKDHSNANKNEPKLYNSHKDHSRLKNNELEGGGDNRSGSPTRITSITSFSTPPSSSLFPDFAREFKKLMDQGKERRDKKNKALGSKVNGNGMEKKHRLSNKPLNAFKGQLKRQKRLK